MFSIPKRTRKIINKKKKHYKGLGMGDLRPYLQGTYDAKVLMRPCKPAFPGIWYTGLFHIMLFL